jgi:hypothetical protein
LSIKGRLLAIFRLFTPAFVATRGFSAPRRVRVSGFVRERLFLEEAKADEAQKIRQSGINPTKA